MREELKYTDRFPVIRCLLILIVFLVSQTIKAQHFSNLYYDNRPFMVFSSIEARDNSFYLTGVTAANDTPHYVKALFGKVDATGTPVFTKSMLDSLPYSYEFYWSALKPTSDGNYIAAGEMIDTAQKVLIAKIDTLGNILLWKQYSDSATNIFQGHEIIELPGQGYLVAINAGFLNGNSEVVIIRTDTNGTIINKKAYDQPAGLELPWVLRPMLNGHFMVGAGSIKSTDYTPFWCKTWMIEIDSMGEMVNQWLDSDATNMWPQSMQQTSDSGWIIVRQHLDYDVSDFQAFNSSIVKYDKSFHKEWEIDTGGYAQEGGMSDVEILANGDYICAGSDPINVTIDSAHMYGWIMKISSAGQILWQRTYLADNHAGAWSYIYDLDVLPNGDLLACGELDFAYNVGITPVQQGWILRTDSNGCVIDNCIMDINTPKPPKEDLIQVWPNSFTTDLSIALTTEHPTAAEFTITNLLGQTIYHQTETNLATGYTKMLDLSYLPNGLYVLEVMVDGERTVKQIVKQ